ncbi:hypothetical protein BDV96DRAFT_577340 [Lophiotrema nucula]|uniref:Secreted protein n=1 Tax=Lophiotrema nucula TaxID=690887 RepID=A0A6A5Z4K5_9PLEO|nr:hypothetical protein BDV96DRAFT_577340 [Lophiotrema nucula]
MKYLQALLLAAPLLVSGVVSLAIHPAMDVDLTARDPQGAEAGQAPIPVGLDGLNSTASAAALSGIASLPAGTCQDTLLPAAQQVAAHPKGPATDASKAATQAVADLPAGTCTKDDLLTATLDVAGLPGGHCKNDLITAMKAAVAA